MGQAVHVTGYRLGYNKKWNNVSFQDSNNKNLFIQDLEMVQYLEGVFSYNKFLIDTPHITREGKDINIFLSYFSILNADKNLSFLNDHKTSLNDSHTIKRKLAIANFQQSNPLSSITSKESIVHREHLIKCLKDLILNYEAITSLNKNVIENTKLHSQYVQWVKVYNNLLADKNSLLNAKNSIRFYINYKRLLKNKSARIMNKYYVFKLNKNKHLKAKFIKPQISNFSKLLASGGTSVILKKEKEDTYKLINALKLKVKETLKFYSSSNINLYIKPCDTYLGLPFTNAAILAKLLAYYYRTNKGSYLRFIKSLFKMVAKLKIISGLQVTVTGRSHTSARSKQIVYKYGRVPTQSLKANIDYYFTKTLDRSGISGIKVWVYGSKV